MSAQTAKQPTGAALDTIEQDVLPSLADLLGRAIDSAGAARPGTDARSRADALREQTRQIIALTRFLSSVVPEERRAQPPAARISA